jgi:serine/threonine protein kinase
LPETLMGAFAARVVAKLGRERDAELEQLADAHPEHADALRRLGKEVAAAERLLAQGFDPGGGALPRSFGDYAIERELGRGGMGIVYAAVQRSLGRRVALKVLSTPLRSNERTSSRFERESRLLAQLEHPGIVRVIEAGVNGDVPYYAMEFVDGAPLSAVLEAIARHGLATANADTLAAAVAGAVSEPSPVSQRRDAASYVATMVDLAAQVAEALAFAHAAGVIHRDVKPGNVLVRRDGTAVLTDFGIARLEAAQSLTLTGAFAGTPSYVSPEQARGDNVDFRSDVFSLGVTLYEALTLRRPFEAEETTAVLAKIQREEPPDPRQLNPDIPAEVAAVVLKALVKEPAGRYATAGALAADLRAFLAGRPVSARPPTPSQRLWRWCRREPWKATALATAAAAAVLIALSTALFTRRLLTENASTKAALDLAQANFDKATQAVDEMLTRVGQRDLAEVPQMELVRRDLLQRALAFYEGFAAARTDDPNVRLQLALARGRVAWINRQLGENRTAAAIAAAVVDELGGLLAASPENARLILEHADAQLTHGQALASLGEIDRARTLMSTNVASLTAARATAELEVRRRRLLAYSFYALADLHRFREPASAAAALERAAGELTWLRRELPEESRIAAMLANAHSTIARMTHNAGDAAAAEASLDRAREALVGAPATPEVKIQELLLSESRAIFHKDAMRLEQAAAESRATVDGWQGLVASFPLTPYYRNSLANAWTNYGNILRYLDRIDDAIAAAREAVRNFEILAASTFEDVSHTDGLGRALVNLGSMLLRRDDRTGFDEGRDTLRRAVAIAERLLGKDPHHAEFNRLLADCRGEEAYAASSLGEHEEAMHLYDKAVEAWGAAAARHPDNAYYRDGQANMLRGAASERLAMGDAAGALETADRALAALRQGLESAPRNPARRRYARLGLAVRAVACAHLGDHASAAQAIGEQIALGDGDADVYGSAVLAAECLEIVGAGAASGGYTARALEALEVLAGRGYKDVQRLESDPRFTRLRGDPGFKELVRRISQ